MTKKQKVASKTYVQLPYPHGDTRQRLLDNLWPTITLKTMWLETWQMKRDGSRFDKLICATTYRMWEFDLWSEQVNYLLLCKTGQFIKLIGSVNNESVGTQVNSPDLVGWKTWHRWLVISMCWYVMMPTLVMSITQYAPINFVSLTTYHNWHYNTPCQHVYISWMIGLPLTMYMIDKSALDIHKFWQQVDLTCLPKVVNGGWSWCLVCGQRIMVRTNWHCCWPIAMIVQIGLKGTCCVMAFNYLRKL